MNKYVRVIIGLVGCIILFVFGLYRLIVEFPNSNELFVPITFTVGGFIGLIGGIMELRKIDVS